MQPYSSSIKSKTFVYKCRFFQDAMFSLDRNQTIVRLYIEVDSFMKSTLHHSYAFLSLSYAHFWRLIWRDVKGTKSICLIVYLAPLRSGDWLPNIGTKIKNKKIKKSIRLQAYKPTSRCPFRTIWIKTLVLVVFWGGNYSRVVCSYCDFFWQLMLNTNTHLVLLTAYDLVLFFA